MREREERSLCLNPFDLNSSLRLGNEDGEKSTPKNFLKIKKEVRDGRASA